MWLYVPPSISSPSVQVSAGSTSEFQELSKDSASRLASSAMWRGKHTRPRYWSSKWKREPWMRRLSGVTLKPSIANRGVEKWISSLVDILASPSPTPESAEEKKTPATYGPTSCGCLSKVGPLFSSPKTCAATSPKVSGKFSGSWPASGSMRNGMCFPLPKRARLTCEKGSSFLPTPTAASYGSSQNGCPGDGRKEFKQKGKPSQAWKQWLERIFGQRCGQFMRGPQDFETGQRADAVWSTRQVAL